MQKLLHFSLYIALLLQFQLATAQNASFAGVVLDEASLPMPGANVLIEELNRGTVTDVDGKFEFFDLPSGDYQLKVSFMGYDPRMESINVAAGQAELLKLSLNPAVYEGNSVVVIGDRLKGQAKALNDQRNRMNISNIVASDQIGRFPDANIGDALKRVPGITMQNDQGEARDIIVRGMAPQLNSVTINGQRVPSAEGDNRRIQMDLIPSDMIQLIEVNKVVTPDMDADAIGGSVNLVTRSVATNKRISGTLASGYNFLSEEPIWTGALILADRFADNKLGAVLSMSYNNHNFGSDNIEAEWVDHDDLGFITDEFQLRTYEVQRIRRSISLGLDYQFSPTSTITLSGIYNWRDDWENRYRYVAADIEDAIDDGAYNLVSQGIWDIEATEERQSKGGIGSDRVDNRRLEDQRTAAYSLRGDHLLGSRIKLTWAGNYGRASEDRKNERYLQYVGEELPMRMDLTNTEKPIVYSISEDQWELLEFDELTDETQNTVEEDLNGKVDLQIPIGNKSIVKVGGVYRHKNKERNNNFFEYTPVGGTNDGDSHPDFGGSWDSAEEEFTDLQLGEVPVTNKSKSDFLAGDQYQAGNYADSRFLGGLDLGNSNLYEEEDKPGEYVPGNYTATENILGFYAMADLQLTDKLSSLVGLRVENTSIDYEGFSYDDDTEEIGTTTGSNDYTNVLPNVQFKYNMQENTIIRLAFSNTLARPGYFQLVPFEEFVPEDSELTRGNPDLDPTVSMNFDLMGEHYFKDIGLVSLGFFYKDVEDFIYEQEIDDFMDPVYGEVDLTVFSNGPKAQVAGLEAAVQKQFGGLGIYLNYTYTHSTTEGIEGRDDEDIALPGTARHMYNASLSYETKKLVLRLSLNHASDYIDELGGEAFEDRFYDEQTFLDFNGSYAINNNWRIFAEWNNITNQPLRFYQGQQNLTMQEEYYNMRFNLGVKFDIIGG